MDGTWGSIASKVREDSDWRFGYGMEFSVAVWSYGLDKEWNLVSQCAVKVWLRNGINFAVWGYILADGLDMMLKVLYSLVKAYILVSIVSCSSSIPATRSL